MATREGARPGGHRYGRAAWGRHWFHEAGMPGWTRVWRGYPCLHWSEVCCGPAFDTRQELDLLREEAEELEAILKEVRERIAELEGKPGQAPE